MACWQADVNFLHSDDSETVGLNFLQDSSVIFLSTASGLIIATFFPSPSLYQNYSMRELTAFLPFSGIVVKNFQP
jgi:hypothetical protein